MRFEFETTNSPFIISPAIGKILKNADVKHEELVSDIFEIILIILTSCRYSRPEIKTRDYSDLYS